MTSESLKLDGLYEVTKRLIEALPGVFLKAEPHDVTDSDGSDLLWFQVEEAQPDVEGEVIALSPGHPGTWYVRHDAIYSVGGSPTFWDKSGTEGQIVDLVVDYLGDTKS